MNAFMAFVTPLAQAAAPSLAALLFGCLSWAALQGAALIAAKTHSTRIGSIVSAAGHIAGDISDKLSMLPPGSNVAAIRAQLISTGVTDIQTTVAPLIAKTGIAAPALQTMIAGELGKLNASNLSVAGPVLAPTVPAIPETSAKETAS